MFARSDDERLVAESVARFLQDHYPFERRRRIVAESDLGYDLEHWQQFAELGLLGVVVPESSGGIGGSYAAAAVICEQFGRTLMMCPFVSTALTTVAALTSAASSRQRDELLPGIADGSMVVACALDDAADDGVDARLANGSLTLSGRKRIVYYAAAATHLLIRVSTGQDTTLLLVPAETRGVQLYPYATYDGGRACDVVFEQAIVDPDARLPGDATQAVEHAQRVTVAMLCAEAAGIMWALQEQTLAYLKTREQFGAPLSTFQTLQHRAVDLYMQCQLVQSMALDAVDALDDGCDESQRERRLSAAKSFIGETGRAAAQEAVQLHGGMGMTDELPIGHYLKRLTAIDLLCGNAAWHRNRFLALDESDSR